MVTVYSSAVPLEYQDGQMENISFSGGHIKWDRINVRSVTGLLNGRHLASGPLVEQACSLV